MYNVSNAGRIIPVPPGFKLEPIDFKLSDAQFLELKQYGRPATGGSIWN
ncbi:MAG: hypothetical protein ACLTKQ_08430 [Acutalibacteraceae bacterium]